MGAWPEREAPAEIFASVNITVEKGMDSSIPFSFALSILLRSQKAPSVARPPGILIVDAISVDCLKRLSDHASSTPRIMLMRRKLLQKIGRILTSIGSVRASLSFPEGAVC